MFSLSSNFKEKIKNVTGVNIYECEKCQVAVLDRNIKSKIDLYSFTGYQSQEKNLEKDSKISKNHFYIC